MIAHGYAVRYDNGMRAVGAMLAGVLSLVLVDTAYAQLSRHLFVSGFQAPLAFVQDPTDESVQFVVQQAGRIRVVRDGAVAKWVSASTQKQAKSAVLFLYKEVLEEPLPWLEGIESAKKPARLPVVLTREEVESILTHLSGPADPGRGIGPRRPARRPRRLRVRSRGPRRGHSAAPARATRCAGRWTHGAMRMGAPLPRTRSRTPHTTIGGKVQYDVYIAYHPSDKRLARALKRAFERFARPWNRIRALNVWGTTFANPRFGIPLFGNLLAGRAGQGRADEALAGAGRLLLLASPEAAKSERVAAEIEDWLEGHPIEDLILVLTAGEMVWDPAAGDFDWARTPSLPEGLKGKFKGRPLVVDLRWARAERKLLTGHTRFRDALLGLLARLHGRSPDGIEADDLRRQRRERLLGAGLLAVLVVGSASALYWAMVASGERSAALARLAKAEADLDRERQARADAERRARAAGARGLSPLPVGARDGAPSDPRQESIAGRLASEAEDLLKKGGEHVPTGVLLAVEAMSRYPSAKADGVLRQGLHALLPPVTALDQEGPVHRAAFSPDGTQVVTAGGDETARVFEVSSGRPIAAIEHDAAVQAVAFSPDGLLVASADADGTVRVSDPKTGQSIATIEEDDPIVAVAFSPDGHFLATAGSDARIYAIEGAREVQRFSHGDAPVGVAFSLDGTTLMTASGNDAVTWDLKSGAETLRMRHDAAVAALAPSADGRYLATAVGDGTVRIWDRGSGRELKRIAQEGPVTAVSYSLDGKYLATASGHGARLLDGEGLRDLGRVVESDPVEGVMLSLDGKLLVTAAGHHAHVFRTTAGVTLMQAMHDDLVQGVALSPDGALLVTASWDKSARIWDTETGRERQRLDHPSLVQALALEPGRQALGDRERATRDRLGRGVRDGATDLSARRHRHGPGFWFGPLEPGWRLSGDRERGWQRRRVGARGRSISGAGPARGGRGAGGGPQRRWAPARERRPGRYRAALGHPGRQGSRTRGARRRGPGRGPEPRRAAPRDREPRQDRAGVAGRGRQAALRDGTRRLGPGRGLFERRPHARERRFRQDRAALGRSQWDGARTGAARCPGPGPRLQRR